MKKIVWILILMVASVGTCFAEEVQVTLPEFDVTINGITIESIVEEYPFVQYKGITYIPMTYELNDAIGLKTSWHEVEGLKIDKAKERSLYKKTKGHVNVLGKKYNASVVEFNVTVNGKVIDSSKETYPLLIFRDVTYFPMTYDFMVNEFNCTYSFSLEKGLKVASDESVAIKIPQPQHKVFDIDIDQFNKDAIYANGYFEINKLTEDMGMVSVDYSADSVQDSILTLWFEIQYEEDHEKVPFLIGAASSNDAFGYRSLDYLVFMEAKNLTSHLEIVSPHYAEKYIEEYIEKTGVEVKMDTFDHLDMTQYKSEGMAYFIAAHTPLDFGTSVYETQMKYAAIRALGSNIGNHEDELLQIDYYMFSDVHKGSGSFESPDKINDYTDLSLKDVPDRNDKMLVCKGEIPSSYLLNTLYLYDQEKQLKKIIIYKD